MASFSYKPKELTDLCHFVSSSATDYGVQCTILREFNTVKEYTSQHFNIIKTLYEGRPAAASQQCNKDVAFLHVSQPGKTFEKFDQEKYKLALVPKAYFKVLEFFQSEWPMVYNRIESDFLNIRGRKEWYNVTPSISFRGPADVQFTLIVDSTDHIELALKVTKSHDLGKTNISLCYTDDTMGSIHLPPLTMVKMAQERAALSTLYYYKEPPSSKKSRQS